MLHTTGSESTFDVLRGPFNGTRRRAFSSIGDDSVLPGGAVHAGDL